MWQSRKEKEALAQGPVAYFIYYGNREKIICVIVMAVCAILCALAVVFIPDVYRQQNNWLDKLLLTLWFIVLVLSVKTIYIRYHVFKFMNSMEVFWKTQNDKFIYDILKRAVKDCEFDKPEDKPEDKTESKQEKK